MTDTYRAMCAELIEAMTDDSTGCWQREADVIDRARALLAEPVAEGPTVMEIIELADEIEAAELGQVDLVRAALARWGRRAALAEPEPGEVEELVAALESDAENPVELTPLPGDAEGLAEMFWGRHAQPEPVGGTLAIRAALAVRLAAIYAGPELEGRIAAALRAAADQVAPADPCGDDCCITQCEQIRAELLAIADELEQLDD